LVEKVSGRNTGPDEDEAGDTDAERYEPGKVGRLPPGIDVDPDLKVEAYYAKSALFHCRQSRR
jgi:hypothetical protein